MHHTFFPTTNSYLTHSLSSHPFRPLFLTRSVLNDFKLFLSSWFQSNKAISPSDLLPQDQTQRDREESIREVIFEPLRYPTSFRFGISGQTGVVHPFSDVDCILFFLRRQLEQIIDQTVADLSHIVQLISAQTNNQTILRKQRLSDQIELCRYTDEQVRRQKIVGDFDLNRLESTGTSFNFPSLNLLSVISRTDLNAPIDTRSVLIDLNGNLLEPPCQNEDVQMLKEEDDCVLIQPPHRTTIDTILSHNSCLEGYHQRLARLPRYVRQFTAQNRATIRALDEIYVRHARNEDLDQKSTGLPGQTRKPRKLPQFSQSNSDKQKTHSRFSQSRFSHHQMTRHPIYAAQNIFEYQLCTEVMSQQQSGGHPFSSSSYRGEYPFSDEEKAEILKTFSQPKRIFAGESQDSLKTKVVSSTGERVDQLNQYLITSDLDTSSHPTQSTTPSKRFSRKIKWEDVKGQTSVFLEPPTAPKRQDRSTQTPSPKSQPHTPPLPFTAPDQLGRYVTFSSKMERSGLNDLGTHSNAKFLQIPSWPSDSSHSNSPPFGVDPFPDHHSSFNRRSPPCDITSLTSGVRDRYRPPSITKSLSPIPPPPIEILHNPFTSNQSLRLNHKITFSTKYREAQVHPLTQSFPSRRASDRKGGSPSSKHSFHSTSSSAPRDPPQLLYSSASHQPPGPNLTLPRHHTLSPTPKLTLLEALLRFLTLPAETLPTKHASPPIFYSDLTTTGLEQLFSHVSRKQLAYIRAASEVMGTQKQSIGRSPSLFSSTSDWSDSNQSKSRSSNTISSSNDSHFK